MTGENNRRIVILDPSTANQIAAGEVVERPASVVKELVENSLDAAARHVNIDIKQGGTTYIRVRDDGWGMSKEDAALAFARHATSKIHSAGDLENIKTLGFRGEALPSIAAVSKVEMDTRPEDSIAGTRVKVAGNKILDITEIGCPHGTVITVTDLFYNTPARRRYLKKNPVESRVITKTVERLALSHPGVAFNLTLDGRRTVFTPGDGDLKTVIATVYGLETGQELLPVSQEGPDVKIEGYISPPWLHHANRNNQVFIVNGRYIYSRALARAVEECYKTVIPGGRYPLFVLWLTVDPGTVDVNVHPSKLEIRFRNENELTERIAGLIKNSLSAKAIKPARTVYSRKQQTFSNLKQEGFDFNREARVSRAWGEHVIREASSLEIKKTGIRPEKRGLETGGYSEKLHEELCSDEIHEQSLPDLYIIGQLFNTYILAEGKNGLYIIDQHAAHELCRFEELKKQVGRDKWPGQMLEPAVTLRLSPSLSIKLVENIVSLREFGFIIEAFGSNLFLLRSVPVGITPGEEKEILMAFLEDDNYGNLPASEKLLKIIACRGAVKAGETMSKTEMEKLLEKLRSINRPYTCPHGRPAIICLERSQLSRYFQRNLNK